jgi:hypothetical protein
MSEGDALKSFFSKISEDVKPYDCCLVCGRKLKSIQSNLDGGLANQIQFCIRCRSIDEVFVYSYDNKFASIPIDIYNNIKDKLRKRKVNSVKLPNVTSSRIVYLNDYTSVEKIMEVYRETFVVEGSEEEATIKLWEDQLEDIEAEIEELQEDAGEQERKIRSYPMREDRQVSKRLWKNKRYEN